MSCGATSSPRSASRSVPSPVYPTCRAETCSTRHTSWTPPSWSAKNRDWTGRQARRAVRRSGDSMIDRPVVGLVANNSPDFVAQAFACWKAGAAVVALRSKEDHERLRLAGGSEVRVPAPGDGWLEAALEPRDDDAVAQILFTSGTEGEPKGVVLTHQNLADVVARLNSVMAVSSEIREYVGVPVYHSFGFGRCRAVSAAGGRAFLPARGFNPVEINSLLEAGQINAISAVPSLWRV